MSTPCTNFRSAIVAITASAFVALPAQAQETDSGSLSLELNALQQVDAACRIVFLATNGLPGDAEGVSFETVLVNTEGVVERLTLFDFKDLPRGRPRVRQFDLPDTDCATIGKLLINGAATCEGAGFDDRACIDNLELSSRTDAEISG